MMQNTLMYSAYNLRAQNKNKKIKTYNFTFTLPKTNNNINTVIHNTLTVN